MVTVSISLRAPEQHGRRKTLVDPAAPTIIYSSCRRVWAYIRSALASLVFLLILLPISSSMCSVIFSLLCDCLPSLMFCPVILSFPLSVSFSPPPWSLLSSVAPPSPIMRPTKPPRTWHNSVKIYERSVCWSRVQDVPHPTGSSMRCHWVPTRTFLQ